MHGRDVCEIERCRGRYGSEGKWRMGSGWLGDEGGLRALNRQRRVVKWLNNGGCHVSAGEENV